MKNLKQITLTILIVIFSAIVSVWVYTQFFQSEKEIIVTESQKMQYANLGDAQGQNFPDLTFAAENSIHAVVHITTQSVRDGDNWSSGNPLFDELFGLRNQQPRIARGFGSGVIISTDGYIVTNNHVIEKAQNIKVIMNDRQEYEAELIGTDPNTDIALLKINASGLAYLQYGNSDALKLGEWVLAVGNPFNLTSTVTAGIVSARARNLGINQSAYRIESFIQTDAAVNPGNSGGALVNQRGQLVGINTAIASRTGSYSGYSFAVPVSIVKKVVSDLKEFGKVQRALLGVSIADVNAEIANKYGLDSTEGVFIADVVDGGAADDAGIRPEDIIIEIENDKINSAAELQEKISRYRPGDKIDVSIKRNNKVKQIEVDLRNRKGNAQILLTDDDGLGAEFEAITDSEKRALRIQNGIKVTKVEPGKLKKAGISKGFIITRINKQPVYSVDDMKQLVEMAEGGVLVEGIFPNGKRAYFVFGND